MCGYTGCSCGYTTQTAVFVDTQHVSLDTQMIVIVEFVTVPHIHSLSSPHNQSINFVYLSLKHLNSYCIIKGQVIIYGMGWAGGYEGGAQRNQKT